MIGQIILFLLIFIVLLAVVFSFSTPTKQPPANNNNTEDICWEEEKQQSQREYEADQNKTWFTPARWLTDKEIDWACQKFEPKIPSSYPQEQYKILPAHQFHYVKEVKGNYEADAHLAFPELLSELLNTQVELVFIPVNNPDFHWSLLVYETKTKCFYHYDTLRRANYHYVKPLVKELLQQIHQTNSSNLTNYLVPCNDIRQGNGYDCGVAVISIIKRIREKYHGTMENINLGAFDFKQERQELRNKYLVENNDE